MKVGILGAGLTGLTLASKLDHDFEILEKSDACGGLCRSIQDRGYTFDVGGGHIIFSKEKDILDFMTAAVKNGVVSNRRNTKILYKNRYVKYPFENGLGDLPEDESFECLINFLTAVQAMKAGRQPKPANFEEWMYRTFGKGITEKYLIPYNSKVWNFPPGKMAADWVADRIPQPPAEDVIRSFLKMETEGYTHQLNFFYPRAGGIQSVTDTLSSGISGKIRCNTNISKVEKKGKWRVHHDGTVDEYDALVSTIPVMELLECLEGVPKDVMEAAKGLKFNSLINVLLGVDKPKMNDFHWVYIPEEDVDFNRLIFLSNYAPDMAPKGKSSVAVELTCRFGDDIWSKSDDAILKEIIEGLERKGVMKASEVCYSKVMRSKYAYVIYDLDYNRNIKTVMDFLASREIELCGRFSEFKYMNMDACIMSAMRMAKKLNGERNLNRAFL